MNCKTIIFVRSTCIEINKDKNKGYQPCFSAASHKGDATPHSSTPGLTSAIQGFLNSTVVIN